MRIANNIPALETAITLRHTDRQVVGAMRQLSSGSKINSAKDDAAGLAIANKLGIQVTGLNRASQNTMDGVSLIQTADGALNEISAMLQRMRELAVQAANGVLAPSDKAKIQLEINQLVDEINANSSKIEFNKIKILSGEADTLTQSLTAADTYGDGIASVLSVSTSLPPGQLTYTINRPGLPAEAVLEQADLRADLKGHNITLTINEVGVEISQSDNWNTIVGKLTDAASLASLELRFDAAGAAHFATKAAGYAQEINITGTDITAIHARGLDADVEVTNFPGLVDASSGVSVRADGNQVTISDTKGQTIKLGLRVLFNPTVVPVPPVPDARNFTYSDGTPIDVAVPINMIANVKDYGPLYLQIGPNFNEHLPVSIPRLDAESLGFMEHSGGAAKVILDYQSAAGASRAIGILDNAIADVSHVRAWLGAYQNRLEQTVMNLDSASINLESARSRIQDTDMAAAMSAFTQYNVSFQAGIAILAQANQRPQQILSLLQ